MGLTINIDKSVFLATLIVFGILTVFVGVAYAFPASGTGHNPDEINWADIITSQVKIGSTEGTESLRLFVGANAYLDFMPNVGLTSQILARNGRSLVLNSTGGTGNVTVGAPLCAQTGGCTTNLHNTRVFKMKSTCENGGSLTLDSTCSYVISSACGAISLPSGCTCVYASIGKSTLTCDNAVIGYLVD